MSSRPGDSLAAKHPSTHLFKREVRLATSSGANDGKAIVEFHLFEFLELFLC